MRLLLPMYLITADVFVELEKGRATLRETSNIPDQGITYDLKVLPGETIQLACVPDGDIIGTYRWNREPDTVLYDSHRGSMIATEDPYYDRIRFEPRSPSRWDEAWRMRLENIEVGETVLFSCSNLFRKTTVQIKGTYRAVGKSNLFVVIRCYSVPSKLIVAKTILPFSNSVLNHN